MTERIAFRVQKGALVPADSLSASRLADRAYKIGDIVFAEVKKPRNPGFHFLAHALAGLASENLEDFEGLGAHQTLKRLQAETGVSCEPMAFRLHGHMTVINVPKSISFEKMAQAEFEELAGAICYHLHKHYWSDVTEEQIRHMAEEWAARRAT